MRDDDLAASTRRQLIGIDVIHRVTIEMHADGTGSLSRHASAPVPVVRLPGRRKFIAYFMLARRSFITWSVAVTRMRPSRGYSMSRMT